MILRTGRLLSYSGVYEIKIYIYFEKRCILNTTDQILDPTPSPREEVLRIADLGSGISLKDLCLNGA